MKNRLYTAIAISHFGNWFTFIAITMTIRHETSVAHISYMFMLQALIPLLFSQNLINAVAVRYYKQVYFATQILLALSTLIVILEKSLLAVYTFIVVSGFLKTLSSPLLQSLITINIDKNESKEFFTRVGAIQAVTMSVSPALGAYLAIAINVNLVLIMDAISFIIPLCFLMSLKNKPNAFQEDQQQGKTSIFSAVAPIPSIPSVRIRLYLLLFFIFMCMGAYLDGIEFKIFEAFKLTDQEVGIIIGCWGWGSLVSFFLIKPLQAFRYSHYIYILGVPLSLTLLIFDGHFIYLAVAFLILGFLSTLIVGNIKGKISDHLQDGSGKKTGAIWAFTNQLISLANVLFLGTLAMAIDVIDIMLLVYGLVTLGVAYSILHFLLEVPRGEKDAGGLKEAPADNH